MRKHKRTPPRPYDYAVARFGFGGWGAFARLPLKPWVCIGLKATAHKAKRRVVRHWKRCCRPNMLAVWWNRLPIERGISLELDTESDYAYLVMAG